MNNNRKLLQVSSEQREELERWAQSRALFAGDVFRTRSILCLAAGVSYREIGRTLGASAPTAYIRKLECCPGSSGFNVGNVPLTSLVAAS